MKVLKSVAAMLLVTLVSWGATPASTTDFYVVYISLKDKNVILLDPATITLAPDNHRIAHFADISEAEVWNDDTYEFDCAGGRLKYLSSIEHLSKKDTMDRSSYIPMGVWTGFPELSKAALMRDAVCQWPDNKKDLIAWEASDYQAAVEALSDKLTNHKDQ